MTEKPPDAPWKLIWKPVVLDGKEYTVYYLGKQGKEMLESAVCKNSCHPFRYDVEKSFKELKAMLNVLTDIIGGPKYMIEYFKGAMLKQLSEKACRQSDLVSSPYMAWKWSALEELLRERKVKKNRSWIKL